MIPLTYAQEGSIAHALAELALKGGKDCAAFIGRILTVEPYEHFNLSGSSAERWINCPGSVVLAARMPEREAEQAFSGEVTAEMAEHVQHYVDYVRSLPGALMVEADVGLEFFTGEARASSRADAIVLDDESETITVIDLKYGMGKPVVAEKNPQLGLCTLGAVRDLSMLCEYKTFRFVIHQPRINPEPSVWECTAEQMAKFEKNVKTGAGNVERARTADNLTPFLHPSDGACQWCRAKSICPALAQVPQVALDVEFTDLTAEEKILDAAATVAKSPHLARFYKIVPLIEQWIDAVNHAMHVSVASGEQPDFKMVAGKRGARKWNDEPAAEAAMKSMRFKQDEMYDFKLISPTTAEKVLAKESPKRWAKLQSFIGQSEGKPTIAKADDKRPAITVAFEALTGAEDLV